MKIALAQIDYIIGDFQGNQERMIQRIDEAKASGADIICFGELSVCGYPPRDFLEFRHFIEEGQKVIEELTKHAENIAIVVGAPRINPVLDGKDLHNSAYFLAEGKVLHIQDKALLPTYDIFDEYRYFEPGSTFKPVEYKGYKIAITICEDIWDVPCKDIDVSIENPLYQFNPLDEMTADFDFILNLSASPFNHQHAAERIKIVKANCRRYGVPMFYVNHVGAQTEIIFDGGSLVGKADGEIYDEMPHFEAGLGLYDLDNVLTESGPGAREKNKIALIHQGLLLGLKDYFGKLGFKKAILGLSGGIDSAVTAVLAAQALGPEHVRVLLMPSQYSSDHSVDDARQLAINLGIRYDIVPIADRYHGFMESLQPLFDEKAPDVTEENIQARVRGLMLMALSNKHGHILLNTTNKSEMAVGYGTLYGDLCGGLSVLGDVYKTEVYELANFINRDEEIIPQNSITKPPSAELRPDQKDSDSLPDYDILDEILYHYIEMREGPQDIIARGIDQATVLRTLKMVNRNEFKRHQTAPILRVSPKAFGMGRRMPIVGRY